MLRIDPILQCEELSTTMKPSYKNILGLQNNGNICYLNSALQCILCIDSFREFILHPDITLPKNVDIFSELKDLCMKYEDPNISLANTMMVKHIFGKYDLFFRNNMQQDSHECLIRILDIIHEKGFGKGYQAQKMTELGPSEVAWNQYIKIFGGSPITDIFAGQLRSTLICRNCKQGRDSFETINNISLPFSSLSNVVDIVDCFRIFFSPENLEDMLTCDHCKMRTYTTKSMKISMYPNVLILNLKRFDSQGRHIRAMVEISENLIFKSLGKNVNYKLKCIVNHFGSGLHSGHYMTTTCQEKWINIDDSNIYSVQDKKSILTSASSYVIIYERIG